MSEALARPAAPHSLTVEEAAQRYEEAGIPRTIRRIQKYCARGDLDCRKVETEFGERYLITPDSIDRHVAQIREALVAAGRAPTRLDAPEPSLHRQDFPTSGDPTPPNVPPRPDAPGRDYQSLYVGHLEKENAFLREQNTVLLERVKETNVLTARLQEMLTPLLGSSGDRQGSGG